MQGRISELMNEILSDPHLAQMFMKWERSSDEEKKHFRFVRYKDTNRLAIIDDRDGDSVGFSQPSSKKGSSNPKVKPVTS